MPGLERLGMVPFLRRATACGITSGSGEARR